MLTSSSPLSQARGQNGREKCPERSLLKQPHVDGVCALTPRRVSNPCFQAV